MAFALELNNSNFYISGIFGKPIKIPSAMYPLNGTPTLLSFETTAPFPDNEETQKIKTVFDSIEQKVGQCYTNAETLQAALQAEGISSKAYVGWQFIGQTRPVHHAIVVIDNHVLDFNIRTELLQAILTEQPLPIDALRQKVVDRMIELKKQPNSAVATFGQMEESTFIICSECKPKQGLQIYNKLVKAYPKHPALNDIDEHGLSKTQKIYFEKTSKDRGF